LGGCGNGSARLYTFFLQATDDCGNAASGFGLARVPHDVGGAGGPTHAASPREPPPFDAAHRAAYGDGCPP